MKIPDYNDLHDRYEVERERELEKLPECCECGEPITTATCFEINGELICPDCIEHHRKWVEDYVS